LAAGLLGTLIVFFATDTYFTFQALSDAMSFLEDKYSDPYNRGDNKHPYGGFTSLK